MVVRLSDILAKNWPYIGQLDDHIPCEPSMLSWRKSDVLAKLLANPDKIFKKNENFVWICQWFSQNIRKPLRRPLRRVSGGSLDDFRRDNIAGPQGIWTWSKQRMDKAIGSPPKSRSEQFLRNRNWDLGWFLNGQWLSGMKIGPFGNSKF